MTALPGMIDNRKMGVGAKVLLGRLARMADSGMVQLAIAVEAPVAAGLASAAELLTSEGAHQINKSTPQAGPPSAVCNETSNQYFHTAPKFTPWMKKVEKLNGAAPTTPGALGVSAVIWFPGRTTSVQAM